MREPNQDGRDQEPRGWPAKGSGLVIGFLVWGGGLVFAFISRPGLYNDPGAYTPSHRPLLWLLPVIGAAFAGITDFALFRRPRDAMAVALYTLIYPLWLVLTTLILRGRQREWATFRRLPQDELLPPAERSLR